MSRNDIAPMTTVIELTETEIEELKRRTNKPDAPSALREAATQYLGQHKHAELIAMAGTLEFEEGSLERLDRLAIEDKHR